MKPSELIQFIALCLSMDLTPAAREKVMKEIAAGKVRWEEFVWKTSSHYVLPAIYSIFRRNGLLHLLPADLEVHMERIYSLNEERNLQIRDQCREMNILLTHNGVEPLFFKGAGLLMSGLFHDPAERMMEDIDLLIRRYDQQKALSVLESAGYHPADGYGEEVYSDHHHLPPLIHRKKPAAVEIHLVPYASYYLPLAEPDEIFNRSVVTGSDRIRVPAPADSLLIAFAHEHRAARGYLSVTSSLKGMYDYFLLSGRNPGVAGIVTEGKFLEEFSGFDFLVRKYFGVALPVPGEMRETREKLWKREQFLLDHPVFDRLWNKIIYRIAVRVKIGFQ